MNIEKNICLYLVPLAAVLAACAGAAPAARKGELAPAYKASNLPPKIIAADDPRLRYEGLFDTAVASAPVIIWQGSRISMDFEGERLAFLFDNVKGQNFFDISVDGSGIMMGVKENAARRVAWPGLLLPGRHQLTMFKRTEASAGTASFLGLELQGGMRAWKPAPPAYKLAMLFLGDSITAGACNEDGPADQWENRATHNNALSYGALTAAAFSADYRNISVSGMGISAGYVEIKAGQAWDRLYPSPDSPRADLKSWTPEVVFINFGENDYSFTHGKGLPFPADFSDGYVALVRAVRQAYPSARLVLLRGGMYGGAQSAELRGAWENAVSRLEASDPAVSHFVFSHWSDNHPRVADDRALAGELAAWLKLQDFMKTYR